jgi:hypothetical protein
MRVEFYSQIDFIFGRTLTGIKAVLSFGLSCLSSITYAQTDTSIIGTWKIVSVKAAGIYFNFKQTQYRCPMRLSISSRIKLNKKS